MHHVYVASHSSSPAVPHETPARTLLVLGLLGLIGLLLLYDELSERNHILHEFLIELHATVPNGLRVTLEAGSISVQENIGLAVVVDSTVVRGT